LESYWREEWFENLVNVKVNVNECGRSGTNPARSAKKFLPEAAMRLGRGRFEGANRPYRAFGPKLGRARRPGGPY